jgi:hypothetical protein
MQELLVDMVASRTFDGRLQLLEYLPTVLAGPPGAPGFLSPPRAPAPAANRRSQGSRER